MQDEGAGDELHLPGHRRLPPRPHIRMRRQLLRPGWFSIKLFNSSALGLTFFWKSKYSCATCSCEHDNTHCLTAEGSCCLWYGSTSFCDFIPLFRCQWSPFNDDGHRFAIMIFLIRMRWWSNIKGRECITYLLSEFNIGFRFEFLWRHVKPQICFNFDTHTGKQESMFRNVHLRDFIQPQNCEILN